MENRLITKTPATISIMPMTAGISGISLNTLRQAQGSRLRAQAQGRLRGRQGTETAKSVRIRDVLSQKRSVAIWVQAKQDTDFSDPMRTARIQFGKDMKSLIMTDSGKGLHRRGIFAAFAVTGRSG